MKNKCEISIIIDNANFHFVFQSGKLHEHIWLKKFCFVEINLKENVKKGNWGGKYANFVTKVTILKFNSVFDHS